MEACRDGSLLQWLQQCGLADALSALQDGSNDAPIVLEVLCQ